MLKNYSNASQETNSRILFTQMLEIMSSSEQSVSTRLSGFTPQKKKISSAVTLQFHYIDCPLTAV